MININQEHIVDFLNINQEHIVDFLKFDLLIQLLLPCLALIVLQLFVLRLTLTVFQKRMDPEPDEASGRTDDRPSSRSDPDGTAGIDSGQGDASSPDTGVRSGNDREDGASGCA